MGDSQSAQPKLDVAPGAPQSAQPELDVAPGAPQSAQAQSDIADNGDEAPEAQETKRQYFFNNTPITDITDNYELNQALQQTSDGDIVPGLTQEVTKTTGMNASNLTGGYRRRKSRKSRKSRRGKKARKSRRTRRHQ
jgi:hypothetical protein